MVEKSEGHPFHASPIPRREFLRRSALALGTLALSANPLATVGEERATNTATVIPAASLFLMGGGHRTEKMIKAIAKENGIPEEELYSPDTLSKAHWETLSRECDKANAYSIYSTVAKQSGIEGKTVVCVTSAEDTDVTKDHHYYKLLFKLLGAERVVVIGNRKEANSVEKTQAIADRKNTPLIYFGGGDQDELVRKFSGTKAFEEMQKRYVNDPDFMIAGTSAGAMMASKHMIHEDKVLTGMELLPRVIVDTHMHRREPRIPRLQKACREHPECLGIGIDEVTGVLIKKGEAKVLGDSGVWKIEPKDQNTKEEDLKKYTAGDKFDLGDYAYLTVDKSLVESNKPDSARGSR